MKKISLALTALLMMIGCSEEKNRTTKMVQFKTLQIDGCEYLRIDGYYGYSHKGNCHFCAERRKQELEELVQQLKDR